MQTLIQNTQAYRLLKSACENNRFSHAYLLLVDDSRNLRSILKSFAKLFFRCDQPKTEREKTISAKIDAENFSDCLFFPDLNKKFMVEDAEKVTEESVLKPVESDKKLFVIGDFAEANSASQNKLLKLLEEPPENVVFLLGATSVFPLLPTVLSRVERLEILPFSPAEITSALMRIYADKPYSLTDFQLVAAACGGSLGGAQNTLEGGDYKELIQDAFSLCLCTGATLPPLVKKIGETKRKKELLFLIRVILRDALVLKTIGDKTQLILRVESEKIRQVADKYLVSSLIFAQECVSKAEKEVFFNGYFPQCLEVLISDILLENAKNKRKEK